MTLHNSHFTLQHVFSRFSLSSLYPFYTPTTTFPLSPSWRLGIVPRWPSWRHHPTVNEWVCHATNNLHSSCLICFGFLSSSHDTEAERVCLGLWRAGSRSTAQGNSNAGSRLIWRTGVGFQHQAGEERHRRLGLSLIWDNVLSLSPFLFYLLDNGLLTMHAFSSNARLQASYSYFAHINTRHDNRITRVLNLNINRFKCLAWGLIIINCRDERGESSA